MDNNPDTHQEKPQKAKIFFLRLIAVLAFGFFGAVTGTLVGRYLVPKSHGLAGAAEVLAYGLFAALIAAVVGFIISGRLKGRIQNIFCLSVFIGACVLFSFLLYKFTAAQDARMDPDSEYANISMFSATLEQIVIIDPYLKVKVDVDSIKRSWINEGPAPENKVCWGIVRAKQLHAIANALENLTLPETEKELARCRASTGQVEQRLSWKFTDGSENSLDISPQCLNTVPFVANMVRAMNHASASPTSRIKCK